MKIPTYTLLVIAVFWAMHTFQSCGFLQKEMTLEELIQDKQSKGLTVLAPNETGFYYASNDSLVSYKQIDKSERIIFVKNSTKIILYKVNLNIANDGEISAIKRYYDDADLCRELNNNLIRGAKNSLKFDTDRFYEDGNFIIEYGDRTFLINPKDDGSIDAVLLYDGLYAEQLADILYDTPPIIIYNFEFNLNALPQNLKPTFTDETLSSALYQNKSGENNPMYYFEYGVCLNTDGTVEQSDHVNFGHLDCDMDKNIFKNKAKLQSYLEKYSDEIIPEYNKYLREQIAREAKSIQYFINLFHNMNLFKKAIGQSFYIKATLESVSEEYEQEYKLSFESPDYDFSIRAVSSDDSFAEVPIPSRVLIKGILESGSPAFFIFDNDIDFKNVELIGIFN